MRSLASGSLVLARRSQRPSPQGLHGPDHSFLRTGHASRRRPRKSVLVVPRTRSGVADALCDIPSERIAEVEIPDGHLVFDVKDVHGCRRRSLSADPSEAYRGELRRRRLFRPCVSDDGTRGRIAGPRPAAGGVPSYLEDGLHQMTIRGKGVMGARAGWIGMNKVSRTDRTDDPRLARSVKDPALMSSRRS